MSEIPKCWTPRPTLREEVSQEIEALQARVHSLKSLLAIIKQFDQRPRLSDATVCTVCRFGKVTNCGSVFHDQAQRGEGCLSREDHPPPECQGGKCYDCGGRCDD